VNVNCDDQDSCTIDTCDPRTGCVHQFEDLAPPVGSITYPMNGSCTNSGVTVLDDFADVCDPAIVRSYSPEGGPSYSAHGDYHVVLTAQDHTGNTVSASVDFTIDTLLPVIELLMPPTGTVLAPGAFPFSIVFRSDNDEDGASGGVIHEVIKLQDRPNGTYCAVYDGTTYGDGDGLLSDEVIEWTQAEICRLSELCGFVSLWRPEIRVEASDCGGNVGSDALRLSGGLMLFPGLCDRSARPVERQRAPKAVDERHSTQSLSKSK
jgi:hypothetical protein